MDWDDLSWTAKLLIVAAGWWGSIVCSSFVLFRHIPIVSYYTVITLMVCYLGFWLPLRELPDLWKRRDKFGIVLYAFYWGFMSYLTVTFMVVMHRYEATGILPEYITDITWPDRWFAPLIYVGAAMCPIIYTAFWQWKKRKS